MILSIIFALQLNKRLNHRWDGMPSLPYFEANELGLSEERFSFRYGKWNLDGSRYWVGDRAPKALVIVFHGLGSGRNAYMKEIAAIAKAGYLVYAYDNLGCGRSEGRGPKSIGEVAKIQSVFFSWLDNDPKAKGLKRYSFGHSWGGYGSMIALRPEFKVEKAVALSGFLRPSDAIYHSLTKKKLGFLKLPISLAIFFLSGPKANISALKVFEKSTGKLFYASGTDDTSVPLEFNGKRLFKKFKTESRLKFVSIPRCGHGAMYTSKAQNYQKQLAKDGLLNINSPIGLEMDIQKATEHNRDLISSIIDFYRE